MDSTHAAASQPLRWDAEVDGITLLPLRPPHPIQWRESADPSRVELLLPEGRWKELRAENWRPFLDPLARGLPLVEVVRHAQAALPHRSPAQVRFLLNRIVGSMDSWGLIEFELPAVPERLDGRYRIERRLGRGGMGIVWEATDEAAEGARVAIKHAWNGTGSFAPREKGLRAEHAAMQLFDHPGIVKARGAFEHEGRFHLVRDLLHGLPLTRAALAGPAERVERTRQAILVIADMLDAGYMHLDVKPSNFFVEPDGRVVLSDLGGVKPHDGSRRVKRHLATYAYCAPEMYQKSVTDERGLVYAMGVFHVRAASGARVKPKAKRDDLLAKLPPDATEAERSAVHVALSPDPADRFASLRALADALRGR